MDHPESIGLPEMATLGRKMEGWSRHVGTVIPLLHSYNVSPSGLSLSRGSSRNTKLSGHRRAHSFENTEHISFQSWRQVWATDIKIVRPEIETSSWDLAANSS